MMISGALRMTSSAVTMRSLADLHDARSAKTSIPPAASISSDTQPMPEIIGSSHSSKYTLGRTRDFAARLRTIPTVATNSAASRSARSAAPTNAPRTRIISRICTMVR